MHNEYDGRYRYTKRLLSRCTSFHHPLPPAHTLNYRNQDFCAGAHGLTTKCCWRVVLYAPTNYPLVHQPIPTQPRLMASYFLKSHHCAMLIVATAHCSLLHREYLLQLLSTFRCLLPSRQFPVPKYLAVRFACIDYSST